MTGLRRTWTRVGFPHVVMSARPILAIDSVKIRAPGLGLYPRRLPLLVTAPSVHRTRSVLPTALPWRGRVSPELRGCGAPTRPYHTRGDLLFTLPRCHGYGRLGPNPTRPPPPPHTLVA